MLQYIMSAMADRPSEMRSSAGDRPATLRRRVRRRALSYKYGRIGVVFLVLIGLSVLDRAGLLLSRPGEAEYYDGAVVAVVRVIDGDTIDVALADRRAGTETTRIRIWGIDCPEIAKPAFADSGTAAQAAEPFGDAATEFTRKLVDGQEVRLVLEPHRVRGYFGRLLAHVEVGDFGVGADEGEDGEVTNLAAALLGAGLARYEDRWYHGFLMYYQQLETGAKAGAVGMWE